MHGGREVKIRVDGTVTNGGAEIVVSDDGKGISVMEKEKIFKKGYGKHTGLGLYLVKEIPLDHQYRHPGKRRTRKGCPVYDPGAGRYGPESVRIRACGPGQSSGGGCFYPGFPARILFCRRFFRQLPLPYRKYKKVIGI